MIRGWSFIPIKKMYDTLAAMKTGSYCGINKEVFTSVKEIPVLYFLQRLLLLCSRIIAIDYFNFLVYYKNHMLVKGNTTPRKWR
jgi:hypothetical protein